MRIEGEYYVNYSGDELSPSEEQEVADAAANGAAAKVQQLGREVLGQGGVLEGGRIAGEPKKEKKDKP